MADAPDVAPRGTLGRWSVLLAIAAFALAIASVAVFASVPKTAPDAARTASTLLFMAAMVAVPVCHFVGFGMGLVALFSTNDRRGLGVTGAILNGLFVAAVAIFLFGFFGTMGSFR